MFASAIPALALACTSSAGAGTLGATGGTVGATGGDNRQFVVLDDVNTAGCLDGSPYAFWIWPGNSKDWSLFFNGGGWAFDDFVATIRNNTALGSSRGYNVSGAWDPPDATTHVGGPAAYTCMGQDPNCTRVYFPYCDGSSFTSHRSEPYQVTTGAGAGGQFVMRGRGNLQATLNALTKHFSLADATRVVVSGGSAGGLSTYLHVDNISSHMKAIVPTSVLPKLVVVARPVAGFFIDVTPYQEATQAAKQLASSESPQYPPEANYSERVRYGMAFHNSTQSLSSSCKAAQKPGEEWRCFLAPVVFPFISQPVFAVQSRFDEYQLSANYRLPCEQSQSYEPPYKANSCGSAVNQSAVVNFGAAFMDQFQTVLVHGKPGTGCFLVSCIQHDINALIHGADVADAFGSWLNGGDLGKASGYKFVDDCGPSADGSTPCNAGAHCAPF